MGFKKGNKVWLGKKHSRETIVKISKTKKASPFIYTDEIRQKISRAGKGRIPWNKGLKGKQVAWNKGLKNKTIPWNKGLKGVSNKVKEKMSQSAKLRISKKIGLPPIHKGEKSHFWKGGISFTKYSQDFNEEFKQDIRLRDDLMCQICEILEEHHVLIFNAHLSVHHINYDKKVSTKENCVTLCRRCHAKTNDNREAWKLFFQTLLSKRYEYKY